VYNRLNADSRFRGLLSLQQMKSGPQKTRRVREQSAREIEHEHKRFISVRVAARRAGLSHTTLHQWARKGQTPAGTRIVVIEDSLRDELLISEDSVLALLENRSSSHDRQEPAVGPSTKSADPLRQELLADYHELIDRRLTKGLNHKDSLKLRRVERELDSGDEAAMRDRIAATQRDRALLRASVDEILAFTRSLLRPGANSMVINKPAVTKGRAGYQKATAR
jgi:hypothetical protein